MTTEKIDKIIYRCDYCCYFYSGRYNAIQSQEKKATENPEIERWFLVNDECHACRDCGHKLHFLLKYLEIEHIFICIEYEDERNELGIIKIRENGK